MRKTRRLGSSTRRLIKPRLCRGRLRSITCGPLFMSTLAEWFSFPTQKLQLIPSMSENNQRTLGTYPFYHSRASVSNFVVELQFASGAFETLSKWLKAQINQLTDLDKSL